jgi:FkbM family methyltransferase
VKSTTLSWLLSDPPAHTIPSIKIIDKIMNFFGRSGYLFVRYSLTLLLGKKKRDRLDFYLKLNYRTNISFSFYLYIFLYKIARGLKISNLSLVKIDVPKYNYKVYCPATEDDYFNLTIRETDIIELFCPKKKDIVLDVGAHLGRYTIISSNRVGDEGKVVAIEASPLVFEKLNRNIKLNKLSNTTTMNYAVYSKKTEIKLYFPSEGFKNSVYNSVMSNRSQDIGKFVNVDANTLDNIIRSIDIKEEEVNWIKIDVEGAELEVLKGAHNILSKSKDIAILIEIHNTDGGKNLYREIMNLLNHYHFKKEYEKVYEHGERHVIVRKKIPLYS